ncbi:capsule biosynthesis protein [Roseicitreum antarcticum]|uniref:Capsular polysaccharide transport system permease protein n=1 Tax=Roseicitreum antarcticum TaxID=564137 RepID=A0A1H3BFV5_9RHOB|nr:capsule biosynthesis protein [Roseicitreum antarcticum]SDX40776.1 capsular polysaccharide transport system permease protein [Roseicitreum antarcticum]
MTTTPKARRFRLRRSGSTDSAGAGQPARMNDVLRSLLQARGGKAPDELGLFDENDTSATGLPQGRRREAEPAAMPGDGPGPDQGDGRHAAAPRQMDRQPSVPSAAPDVFDAGPIAARDIARSANAGRQPTGSAAGPGTTTSHPARANGATGSDATATVTGAAAKGLGQATSGATQGAAAVEAEHKLAAIRAEALTGRQLRMAMRVATRHGIRAASGEDAVRQLRERGIDPFERSNLMALVKSDTQPGTELTTDARQTLPAMPRATRVGQADGGVNPALAEAAAAREKDLARIQRQIMRRRRKRMLLLGARLFVFVTIPTMLVAYYFFFLATPLYATNTEFVIQQADSGGSSMAGELGGMLGGAGLGGSADSVTVQSYLQSRGALRRLDAEHGFKAHFSGDNIDMLRRLDPDATDEAAYRLYQRHIMVGFDPTEGVVKLEVIAADPETSERFATALLGYAEEQVDSLTQRLRENQMRDATQSYEDAERRMQEARTSAVELQEQFNVMSAEVEVSILSQQITALETELSQARLSLQQMLSNARPNTARVEPLRRRIANMETEIANLRDGMTQSSGGENSLARMQSELISAEADVETRQMLLAQSLQMMETARLEANRQVRYLSVGVTPIAPDEPTYPRAVENTFLAFLVFSGVYLMLSMTAAILREQVAA